MADITTIAAAGIGLAVVAGIVALTVWSLVEDERQERETNAVIREAENFLAEQRRYRGIEG